MNVGVLTSDCAGACRSCGAPVVWGELGHRPHPFNPDGTSHFATCPQADAWRPKRETAIVDTQQEMFG